MYSSASTTYVTSGYGQQHNSVRLVARGPQSPMQMQLPPHHGLHNMPSPQASTYDHTANWDRSQQPPPIPHGISPYGNIPLPPVNSQRVEINPALEYAPLSIINWDVSCPASHAVMDPRFSSRGHSLDRPATRPSLSSMTIRTPFSTRPIHIHHSYGSVVTVRDVLSSVYEHLRQCASELVNPRPLPGLLDPHQQQHGLGSDSQIQMAVSRLLGQRTRWAGLSPSSSEPDVWVLHVK